MAIHNPVTTMGVNASGDSEAQLVTNGAALVADAFKPSSYPIDLTMDGTAQSYVLPTGTTRVSIVNLGATGEFIRYAFGTDASDAETNLGIAGGLAVTGVPIPAAVDGTTGPVGVPALAAAVAVANGVNGETQDVAINAGV